jgi:hypothetical protein
MSNVFYGAWLVRQGDLGWATHRAWFQEVPITATIQLSSFMIQEGQNFASFRPQNVQAYIETVLTPVGELGFPNPNKLTDNNVWLTTDNVTFQLQAQDVVATSAFGLIHDRSASALNRSDILRSLDFAVYDDDGNVIGTHGEAQLYGGRELDADEIQEGVLTRANAESDRSLQIVPVDLSDFRSGDPYKIDPRSKRPVRLQS